MAPNALSAPASRVLETLPASPVEASEHFRARLRFETDASDVKQDLDAGRVGFILVDARSPESYLREHIPGAMNLHHRKITAEALASYPKDTIFVTYCSGVFCNASTKAAAKLSALGYRVKELLDGLAGWKEEGYPTESGAPVRGPGR